MIEREPRDLYEWEMRAAALGKTPDSNLVEAYLIVTGHVASHSDVVRAIQKIALHLTKHPVSVLLDERDLKPEPRGVHMGVRIGIQLLLDELTNPEEIEKSVEAYTPQKEK